MPDDKMSRPDDATRRANDEMHRASDHMHVQDASSPAAETSSSEEDLFVSCVTSISIWPTTATQASVVLAEKYQGAGVGEERSGASVGLTSWNFVGVREVGASSRCLSRHARTVIWWGPGRGKSQEGEWWWWHRRRMHLSLALSRGCLN